MWLIWMAAGAFTFFITQSFYKRLKEKGIKLKWYQLLVFGIWYALAILAIDVVVLSIAEGEARAAAFMGMGLIAIILVLLPFLRKMLTSSKLSIEKRGEMA